MNTLIRYIIAKYYLHQYAKDRRAICKVSKTGTYYVLVRGAKGWCDRARIANHSQRNRRGNVKRRSILTGRLEHDIIVKGFKITHYKKKAKK